MANKEMKTLKIGANTFEIVDEKSRAVLFGESVVAQNLIPGLGAYGGYFNGWDGSLNTTDAYNLTVYTDPIAVSEGETLDIEYKLTPGSSTMWIAYGLYDSEDKWLTRNGGQVTGETVGGLWVYKESYTIPAGVSSIRIMCRTDMNNGKLPSAVWANGNPPSGYLDDKVSVFRKNEKDIADAQARMLPQATIGDEGNVPFVENGKWGMRKLGNELDIVSTMEGVLKGEITASSLLDGVPVYPSYLSAQGEVQPTDWAIYCTVSTEKFAVTAGDVLNIEYKCPLTKAGDGSSMWRAYGLYDANENWVSRFGGSVTGSENGSFCIYTEKYTVPGNVAFMCVMCRTDLSDSALHPIKKWGGDGTPPQDILSDIFVIGKEGQAQTLDMEKRLLPLVSNDDNGKTAVVVGGKWQAKTVEVETSAKNVYVNPNVKAVNHRGYNTEAPENTLSAYKLSKKKGFDYVECDVSLTSDGVPVLLHDSTVDRTSNGSGNISSLSLAQVKAMDFGSWFSEEYTGETIPTLEEFIILCKYVGLHPYIELKDSNAAVPAYNVVKRLGMLDKVTWISFNSGALSSVKNCDSKARLGLVIDTGNESVVSTANALKNNENEVFIDIAYGSITSDFVTKCVESNIPLEVWTINSASALTALDPYVSGYTSDSIQANVALYDAFC